MFGQLSISFFILSLAGGAAAADQKWDYISNEYGVDAWAMNFPACNGSSQSPIDIVDPIYSNLGDISFTNYDALPQTVNATATNNGHTYSVSFSGFTDSSIPKIANGGLPGEFELAAFHFHWGDDHSLGSEHHVNNMSYPAELHLVHLNKNYPNVSVGLNHADGLAVLGVLIQRGQHNNNYNFLNLSTHNVTYPGATSNIDISTFMDLLPSNKSFYRYNGSLTTPGCQQVVTWTVFSNAVEISDAQFNALRDMKYYDRDNMTQRLVNNHRPMQPLNGRQVLAFRATSITPTSTMAIPITSTSTMASNITPTSTMASNTTSTPTGSAFRVSENHFMFLASLSLILLSFLEI